MRASIQSVVIGGEVRRICKRKKTTANIAISECVPARKLVNDIIQRRRKGHESKFVVWEMLSKGELLAHEVILGGYD